jgi:DNA invertase Pin-like site-specific DNA recombinase
MTGTVQEADVRDLVAAIDRVAPRRRRSKMRPAARRTAVGYVRVSTAEQAQSGLGMAAQRSSIEAEAERRGLRLIAIQSDDGLGGGSLHRPALQAAMDAVTSGEAGTLIVARLDRLTRSVGDLCDLMDRSATEGWALAAADGALDTGSPMGRLMATVAGAFAELERSLIRQRTKDALAVKRASGARLGRPVELPDAVRFRIGRMRADGMTLEAIADQLRKERVATARGGEWRASGIAKVLDSLRLDAASAS